MNGFKWEAALFALALSVSAWHPINALAQSSLRITGISVSDSGTSPTEDSTTSIDVIQDQCSDGTTTTDEPFANSLVAFTVNNTSHSDARFTNFRYEIRRIGNTSRYTSPRIYLVGDFEVPAQSEKTVMGLLFNTSNGLKVLPRSNKAIGEEGFRTVKFTLNGTLAGRTVTLKGATTLSFDDFSLCSD